MKPAEARRPLLTPTPLSSHELSLPGAESRPIFSKVRNKILYAPLQPPSRLNTNVSTIQNLNSPIANAYQSEKLFPDQEEMKQFEEQIKEGLRRFMNIKMSPFQATQALFTAYHRQRLFARSFKTQTPDLFKEKEKKKEKFDILALSRWFVNNKNILTRKSSVVSKKGKHFLEDRRKTQNQTKDYDVFQENEDLFRSRTKSSFDIEDPMEASARGKKHKISRYNRGHKKSSMFNASSISSGIAFYPRKYGLRQFESTDSRDETIKVDGTSIGGRSISDNKGGSPLPRLIETQKAAYLTNIQICLDELEQGASPKSKLSGKKREKLKPLFGATVERMLKLSGERGIRGSFEAKERLKERRERETAQKKKIMREFMKADTNIVRSIRLKNLLEEKWHETPNGYRILTRLTPRKEDRVHRLLGYDSRKIK